MGQQYLLLLVLVIVTVGGIVVAGAHALNRGETSGQRTMVFRTALSIVDDVQAWKRRPIREGGGDGIPGFANINFSRLGYGHHFLSKRVYKTDVGCYVLRAVGPDHAAELTISAPSCAARDYVAQVQIRGTGPSDIDWIPPEHGGL